VLRGAGALDDPSALASGGQRARDTLLGRAGPAAARRLV